MYLPRPSCPLKKLSVKAPESASALLFEASPKAGTPVPSSSAFLSLIGLTFGVMLLFSGCGESVKIPDVPDRMTQVSRGATRIRLSEAQERAIGLKSATVTYMAVPMQTSLNGRVEAVADHMAHVYTPTNGRTIQVPVVLGQRVQRGQTLAVLKADQVGQIEADLLQNVLQSDADIRQGQVQLQVSRAAFERETKLYRDKISAKADLESARAQYQKDTEQLRSLQTKRSSTILTAQERLSLYGVPPNTAAKVVKNRSISPFVELDAPRSGLLIARNLNEGELADPSKELFTVADLNEVWLVGNVFENDVQFVHTGQPVQITLDSLPNRVFKGTVQYVADILDPQTRTLDLRVSVPNPHEALKPNMFARMKIRIGDKSVLAVPREALQRNGEFTFAYVLTNVPHEYEERKVTSVDSEGNWTPITTGLRKGEAVVTRGSLALQGEALKLAGAGN